MSIVSNIELNYIKTYSKLSKGVENCYLNGNYLVEREGLTVKKRALRAGEELESAFPDSIDLKLTNRCNIGCLYCHESSNSAGSEFDIDRTKAIFSNFPKVPIEIAIGGGDIFTISRPKIVEFIKWLYSNNFLPRVTVNYKSLVTGGKLNRVSLEYLKEFEEVTEGRLSIGISISSFEEFKTLKELIKSVVRPKKKVTDGSSFELIQKKNEYYDIFSNRNIVYHVIAGLVTAEDIKSIMDYQLNRGWKTETVPCDVWDFDLDTFRLLILGYKQWGRAKGTELPREELEKTREYIKDRIDSMYLEGSDTTTSSVGFDNLAIEQLGIRDLLDRGIWDLVYLGEEGSHSMYIDAVKEEYSRTSRTPERTSWSEKSLLEFFKSLKDVKDNR